LDDIEGSLRATHPWWLARFDEGLVLSRNIFDWRPGVATLPVWAFLAGLREQPLRRITFA
jgi:hypothetical protein